MPCANAKSTRSRYQNEQHKDNTTVIIIGHKPVYLFRVPPDDVFPAISPFVVF